MPTAAVASCEGVQLQRSSSSPVELGRCEDGIAQSSSDERASRRQACCKVFVGLRAQAAHQKQSAGVWESQRVDPPGRWTALLLIATICVFAMSTWFSATAVIGTLTDLWGIDSHQATVLTAVVNIGFVAGALAISASNVADLVSSQTMIGAGCAGTAARPNSDTSMAARSLLLPV